ncbi:MAG: hypothetical protein K5686_05960 [Lachnospiraceae bacterium]|nr:hypothetical protein [Lachnospiraceae bacterium]
METRTLNSKRNIIAGILSNCLIPVFAFVIKSAIVRYFSVEYIGLTTVFSSVFQILNIAELGFSTAITVNLYKPLKENDTLAVRGILSYYRRIYRIIGIVILTAGIIVGFFIKKIVGDTGMISENIFILYIIYLTEKVCGFLLFAYKEALFNAAQRLDITKVVYISIYFFRGCFQLLALIVFRNFYLFAAVFMMATLIYNIVLNILSKKKFAQYYPEGTIDEDTRRNVMEQVAGLSVSNVLGVSRDSLNPIIVTSYLGLTISGQYSNYLTIYGAVIGFFLVITKAIQASIGNSIVSENVEKNYTVLTRMEFLHNFFITACTAYMLCLYQPFMKLWMGEGLMFSNPVMMLFVVYFYIRAMSEVRNAYFSALGYWWKAKWIFVTEAVVVIALMRGLGKLFGVAGVVVAPSISILTINYIGITNLLFREYFGSGRKEFYTNRLMYTVITLITCGISWYSCGLVTYEGIPGLVIRIVVCSLILMLTVPALMYLFKRKYLMESITFIKQIIRA